MHNVFPHPSGVTGELAPQHIFAAVIQNQTEQKIHCLVEYRTLSGTDNDIIEFDVDENGGEHKCEERIHISCSSSSVSSNMYPKVIHSLLVKKSDGSTLRLVAPFEHVPHDNQRRWRFIVEQDRIQSEAN